MRPRVSSSSEPQQLESLLAAGLPGPVCSGPGSPAIPIPCALPASSLPVTFGSWVGVSCGAPV